MSKVLFISNFRDGTGWSHGAIDYALALDSVGVDVVVRSIKLNTATPEVPRRIEELSEKSAEGCDVCIQMVLPHMLEYHGGFRKNIAIYFSETDSFRYTDWPAHINMMDEAWVPCYQGEVTSHKSGVEVPVNVVPYPCDLSKFQKHYKPLKLKEELQGKFLFYTIGEMVKRKNLFATLKAFHLEFGVHEPVELLIKTTGCDVSSVRDICNQIKTGIKLYPKVEDYKQELVLTDYLSETDMLRLHATGDCFVGPSYGEGWGIPAFEAMAMGKTPIVSKWGAFRDYVGDGGTLVTGHLEPVYGMDRSCPLPNLYSGRENWFQVDISLLRWAMRQAYNRRKLPKTSHGLRDAAKFSYEKIGNQMKALLQEDYND